jgi:ribosomal-protein-serine acetyltransferase
MSGTIFDTIHRDREYLRKWLPFIDGTQQVSDTEDFIRSVIAQPNPRRDEVFAIWYNEEFAGLIGLKDTDYNNRKTETGYWLAKKMQGKGIITQCVKTLIRYAFQKLKMNRIQIKVATGNEKSKAIPLRLGFQYEGIERQGERCNNKYFDLQVFSLLKTDL